MKSFAAALAIVSAAHAAVDPASITSMSSREETAFREVSLYCERDVQRFCGRDGQIFTDIFFLMPPAPPILEEMESFIDNMIQSSLRMPSESFLFIVEEEEYPKPSVEERTIQHVLAEIAGQTPPENVPDTAGRIAEHGSLLLESQPQDESQARVARRLSEVTPEDLRERQQALLPYSAAETECLRAAYSQARLSISCGRAIFRLDQLRDAQYRANVKFEKDRAVVLMNLIFLYALVLATGMVIYARRRKDLRAKRRLTRQMFQAIYSRPELKQAVEQEMGRSVGHVPPLPTPMLWRMGLLGQKLRAIFTACRWVRLLFVTLVTICFVFAPLSTLPMVVGYAAAVFWWAIFSPKPVDICACCCCGATTQAVKDETLTAEQECCSCCQGTGVCSVQCASCCGPHGDKKNQDAQGCCGCCGGMGCCCCCMSDDKMKGCCDGCRCCSASKKDGVEGCCDGCCCCSASKKDGVEGCCDGCCCCCSASKKTGGSCGKDAKVEGCCDSCCCCKGGCCAGGTCCQGAGCGTCCCCTGSCCCCAGQCCMPNKEQPQMIVYEGVPVQIV